MPEFVLTDENYYSREADMHYMSCSQYQSFQRCEAATIAKMRGIWEPETSSDALLQGQYFHAALESPQAFQSFCDTNFDTIFKTKTTKARGTEVIGKYAPFETLDKMLEVAHSDPVISKALSWPGQNEFPMIGIIGGIPWRIKIDKYADGRKVIDWKTSANLYETYYNYQTKSRQSFIEEYGYMLRAAVYGEIEKQHTNSDTFPLFLIFAISKQNPPDRGAYCLNDDARWNLELETIRAAIPRIQRLKDGVDNPRRCGTCEYCRKTKRINRIQMYTDLMPEFRYDPDNLEFDDYGGSSVFDTL